MEGDTWRIEVTYRKPLAALAERDRDFASTENQLGFSRFDTQIGHSLLAMPVGSWSPAQLQTAYKILGRYKNTQLKAMGFDYAALPEPPKPMKHAGDVPGRMRARIWVEDGAFCLQWNTSDPLMYERLGHVRRIPTARFDPGRKLWRVPIEMSSADAIAKIIGAFAATSPFEVDDDVETAVTEAFAEGDALLAASRADSAEDVVIHGILEPDRIRPFQRAGIAYATRTKKCLIADDMGLGKGLLNGTGVLTKHGFRPIESLKVGDKVIGRRGQETRVTGVFPQREQPVYRVTFNDGSSVVTDGSHRWAVQHVQNGRRNPDDWQVKNTRQLLEEGYRDNSGNATWRIPMMEPVDLAPTQQELDPYLLGLLLGDGGFANHTVTFTTEDVELAEEVVRRVPDWLMVSASEDPKRPYDYRIKSAHAGSPNTLIRELKKLLLMGRTSHDKFVPREYLWGSADQRLALLRGLMDTDGSAGKDGTNEFCTVSKQLADDVVWLVQSLGGTARRGEKNLPNGGTAYRVNVKLMVCPFALSRKAAAWKAPTKYPPGRIIKSIEEVGRGKTTCISVAAPDELFVTEHCIVTHNTLQALATATTVDAKRVLIVCPASLKLNWKREIMMWVDGDRSMMVLEGTKPHNLMRDFGFGRFTIVNYDILHAWAKELGRIPWDVVIADECHMAKSWTARRTKALQAIIEDSTPEVVLMLSGTPMMNRPAELWPIIQMLGGQRVFGSWDRFAYTYCGAQQTRFGFEAKGATNLEELNTKLRGGGLMVRRRKTDVLKELPPRQWSEVPVAMSRTDERKYAEIEIEIAHAETPGAALAGISKLRRAAWEAKRSAAKAWIDNFLESGEKLVVFGWHRDAVLQVAQWYNAPTIMGAMKREEVEENKRRFQEDPSCRVISCNIMAGGVGHTLTAASNVLFLEFAWNGALMDQALDRVHRIGQEADSVTGWMMGAVRSSGEETVDQMMMDMIAYKRDITTRGSDGSGRSVQSKLLAKWRDMLVKEELRVVTGENEEWAEVLAG